MSVSAQQLQLTLRHAMRPAPVLRGELQKSVVSCSFLLALNRFFPQEKDGVSCLHIMNHNIIRLYLFSLSCVLRVLQQQTRRMHVALPPVPHAMLQDLFKS